jgi:hypothetical protein
MEWVEDLYNAGNTYVHLENAHIYSTSRINENDNNKLDLQIGYGDSFIPDSMKYEAIEAMIKIVDAIIKIQQKMND